MARNQAKVVVPETAEEKIVSKIRDVMRGQDIDKKRMDAAIASGYGDIDDVVMDEAFLNACQSVREWSSVVRGNFLKVFWTDDAFILLPSLLRLGAHVRTGPIFKTSFLNELVSGGHGGVSLLLNELQ
jgi:hypothetical protein